MAYPDNIKFWPVGSLVIHKADAKNINMLMQVISYTKDGMVRTKYFKPHFSMPLAHQRKVWINNNTELLDPADFDIPISKVAR